MGEIIGRCVSRKEALRTLRQSQQFIPEDTTTAYVAALNRVRFEFQRHDPVEPDGDYCGNCGEVLFPGDVYCPNCGREISRQ